MIGKDLSRVCLPVYFNEPLSMLQKLPEDVEYSELLDKVMRLPAASDRVSSSAFEDVVLSTLEPRVIRSFHNLGRNFCSASRPSPRTATEADSG
jgi:hypothetical protein